MFFSSQNTQLLTTLNSNQNLNEYSMVKFAQNFLKVVFFIYFTSFILVGPSMTSMNKDNCES